MTKEQFDTEIVDMLVGAYGSRMEMTDLKSDTYFKFLKKYEAKDVWAVAHEWVITNRFAPTISDLLSMLEQDNE